MVLSSQGFFFLRKLEGGGGGVGGEGVTIIWIPKLPVL